MTEHNNQITNTVERLKYLTWRTIVENAMYSQGFINGSICLSIGKFITSRAEESSDDEEYLISGEGV